MESQSCINKLFEVEIGLFQKKVNTIAVEAWVENIRTLRT